MRISLFIRLFWRRLNIPKNKIPVLSLVILQIAQLIIRESWDSLKSFIFDNILDRVGIGQMAKVIMENPLIFWPLFILLVIVLWIALQTKKHYWGDFSEQLVSVLDNMHKRIMEIEKEQEQQPLEQSKLHNVIILVADDLEIVRLDNWPSLVDKFKEQLGLTSDELPTSKEEIEKISRELLHHEKYIQGKRSSYTLEDAKNLASYMDAEHIGVGETRNKDKIWNKYYDELLMLQRAYDDERLNVIIEKHIEYSYIVASFALWKQYSTIWEEDVYLHYFYAKFIAKTIDFERKSKYRVNELIKQVIRRTFRMKYLNTEYKEKRGRIRRRAL